MTFPAVIDNTMLTTYRACPTKFKNSHIDHWSSPHTSVHLYAGACWASALHVVRKAYYGQHLSELDSLALGLIELHTVWGDYESPFATPKTKERLSEALVYYFTAYPLALDNAKPYSQAGKVTCEFSFLEPIPGTKHPISGEPIYLSGRADMLCDYAGAPTIFDDKTTTSLGQRWSNQWPLRSQFTGYSWAAHQMGIPAKQILVRGISILQTKFEHAEAITYRGQWQLDAWLEETQRQIKSMILDWECATYQHNYSDACNAFGGCTYFQSCQSPNPEKWLDVKFIKKEWKPHNV